MEENKITAPLTGSAIGKVGETKTVRNLYVFDLDGTLCNINHRLKYIKNNKGEKLAKPDWDKFFKECVNDEPIPETMEIFHTMKDTGKCVCIVSGRSDEVMEETVKWLKNQGVNVNSGALGGLLIALRKAKDYRPDVQVKQELLAEIINYLHKQYPNILWHPIIFEDRSSVVLMWRKVYGFQVYQVAQGDF